MRAELGNVFRQLILVRQDVYFSSSYSQIGANNENTILDYSCSYVVRVRFV